MNSDLDTLRKLVDHITGSSPEHDTIEKLAESCGTSKFVFSRMRGEGDAKQRFAGRTRREWLDFLLDKFDLAVRPGEGVSIDFDLTRPQQRLPAEPASREARRFHHFFSSCIDAPGLRREDDRSQVVWGGMLMVTKDWSEAEVWWHQQADESLKFKGKLHRHSANVYVMALEGMAEPRKRPLLHGSLVLNRPAAIGDANSIRGTYSIFQGDLLAGKAIFERVADFETARQRLGTVAEAQFQSSVVGKRIMVEVLTEPSRFRTKLKKRPDDLKRIAGRYRGHYFSQIDESVCEMELVVRPNRSVSYRSVQEPRTSHGYAFSMGNRYLFALNHRRHSFPMMTAAFDFEFDEKGEARSACGNYLVADFRGRSVAGRIWLERESPEQSLSKPPLEKVGAGEHDRLSKLFDSKDKALLPFLIGDDENPFLDNASRFLHLGMGAANEKLLGWAGTYAVYCLSHFDSSEKDHSYIQRLRLDLRPNGSAALTSIWGEEKIYRGHFQGCLGNDDMLIGQFREEGQQRTEHLFTLALWRREGRQGELSAAYGGRTFRNLRPTAGRMKLHRLEENAAAGHSPRNYNLSILKEVELLIRERPFLLDFFCGEEDEMAESYRQLNNNMLLPRTNMARDTIIDKQLPGAYLTLRTRFADRAVNLNPLFVHDDGRFEMKSTRPGVKPYYGAVKFLSGNLFFQTGWLGRQEHFSYSMFRLGERKMREVKKLQGVGLVLTLVDNHPVAGLELLVPMPKAHKFETMHPAVIEIENPCLDQIKWLTPEARKAVDYFLKKEKTLLRWPPPAVPPAQGGGVPPVWS